MKLHLCLRPGESVRNKAAKLLPIGLVTLCLVSIYLLTGMLSDWLPSDVQTSLGRWDSPESVGNSDLQNLLMTRYRESCSDDKIGAPICPRLFVIGAQKGGTTTIYRHFSRHRDFAPAKNIIDGKLDPSDKKLKELHYFTYQPEDVSELDAKLNVAGEYLPHFEPRTNKSQWSCDGSPSYLYTEHVPTVVRRAGLAGRSRFIVVLRDPIERAVSAMDRIVRLKSSLQNETVSYDLEEVASRCLPILQKCRAEAAQLGQLGYFHCKKTVDQQQMGPGLCEAWSRGFYVDSLRSWLRAGFDGRKDFCVIRTEQLAGGPDSVLTHSQLARCLRDTDVDPTGFPVWEEETADIRYNIHNTSEKLKGAALTPQTLKMVESFFTDGNRQLAKLLETEFGVSDFDF